MTLDEKTVERDPVAQFASWYDNACRANIPEPNAMLLSTVGKDRRPSARVMLLKGFGPEGFSFFTNYTSRKAEEISQNPFCCVTFFWPSLGQQIRIQGELRLLPAEVSDAYFISRPRGSRIGAWASPQSKVIASRETLDELLQKQEARFAEKEVLRPGWWGGYLLVPDYFEFWQAGDSRIHDRVCYRKTADGWTISRLAP